MAEDLQCTETLRLPLPGTLSIKYHGQFKSVQSQTGLKIFSPISLKYEVIIITLYFKVLLYNLKIAI